MLNRSLQLFVILLLPALALAEESMPWDTRLPFEKATIKYLISGVEQGESTLYLRAYGKESVRYDNSAMEVMGLKKVSETIEFTDPDWIYLFDLQQRTATKSANPQKYMREEYRLLSEEEKAQVRQNSGMLSIGPVPGAITGEEMSNATTILGYSCDKTELMGATVYSMHQTNIPLKTESYLMGMEMRVEAVSVETGIAPEKYFQHPEDITPVMDEEADAMARSVARETIAMLKDSEALLQVSGSNVPDGQEVRKFSPEEQEEMEEALEVLREMFGN